MSPNERERGRESAITFASSSRPSASHRWPGACASSHARYLHRHIQSNRRRSHQHLENRTEQELGTRDMNKQNKKRRAEGESSHPWWQRWPCLAAPAAPRPPPGPPAPPLFWLDLAGKRRAKPWRGRLYRGRRPRVRVYSQVGWADPTVEIMRPLSIL